MANFQEETFAAFYWFNGRNQVDYDFARFLYLFKKKVIKIGIFLLWGLYGWKYQFFHVTLRLFLKPFPLFGLKMKEYQEKKETYKQKIKEGFKL